jgi:hypothetical protein
MTYGRETRDTKKAVRERVNRLRQDHSHPSTAMPLVFPHFPLETSSGICSSTTARLVVSHATIYLKRTPHLTRERRSVCLEPLKPVLAI